MATFEYKTMSTTNKKRGRKKKEENIQIIIEEAAAPLEAPALKKRGRKPKGGKLINKNTIEIEQPPVYANVILHLKCSLKDIQGCEAKTDPLAYNPAVPP